jgi:hypothetical protein
LALWHWNPKKSETKTSSGEVSTDKEQDIPFPTDWLQRFNNNHFTGGASLGPKATPSLMENITPLANMNVVWAPEAQSLINWFVSTNPPPEPFYLQDHLHVRDPVKFFEALRR